jgi:glutaminyl-peptide cyclotransferase
MFHLSTLRIKEEFLRLAHSEIFSDAMNLTHTLILCILLLLGCSKEQPGPAEQKPVTPLAKIDVPSFDSSNAFRYLLKQTSFGPRVPGSIAHDKCLAFFQKELSGLAEAVNLQTFTQTGYDGKILSMTNVIASFNLKTTARILLLAHWDSRPRADQDPNPIKRSLPILGANDGASGVAVLMEIANQLKNHPCPVGVDILLTDGEDYGKEGDLINYFLGARYFAQNLPTGYKPIFGILLDMIGDRQLTLLKEPYSVRYAPDVVNLVWNTAKDLGIYQFEDRLRAFNVQDDHLPLNEAGIKTIDLIDFGYPDDSNQYWHTTADTPDKCSAESLWAVGNVLLNVLYHYPSSGQ